ncbi:MAG: hypothetical protein QG646_1108 [Euryarchaeota archaeon]|nr:hypothetical protein [Euryarchaeota archaeon]
MLKLSNYLEKRISNGKYDVVISVESPFSYVLTKDLGCLKIFSWESSWADELYFESYHNNSIDFDRIREIRSKELEICEKSDFVVFPWQSTENYIRRNIYDGSNFVTLKFGCYPKSNTAQFFFPASIVSVGAMHAHCQNPALLAYLTKISDYAIDIYGSKPDRRYKLNYKGFASSLDVLYNYQFGLNTISKDIYRQSHFSSRVLAYLAYGLPVLSPDWMQLSHELKGCLPYNEDNFVDLVDKYSERREWEKLSREAYAQACQLNWNNTLSPLERMICKC